MDSFVKQIKAEGRRYSFSFLKVYTTSGMQYYVTVADNEKRPLLFHMKESYGKWKIVDAPKVPDWIHALESELEKAILSKQ